MKRALSILVLFAAFAVPVMAGEINSPGGPKPPPPPVVEVIVSILSLFLG